MLNDEDAISQQGWYNAASSFAEWAIQMTSPEGIVLAPGSRNALNPRRVRRVQHERGFSRMRIDS
jgi:hypothetical protein